jgi:hypothetical protein
MAGAGLGAVLLLVYAGSGPRPGPLPRREFALTPDQLPDSLTTTEVSPEVDRLAIPSLGVDAPLDTVPTGGDQLLLPADISHVALWDGSAGISAVRGSLLVAGHLDNADGQAGALHDLAYARPGAELVLVRHQVTTRWRVSGLRVADKADLPKGLWSGSAGPRRLYVVTCGGPVVDGHYADNVIVTALPVRWPGREPGATT